MFARILIANRGEIARRLIRSVHDLGLTALALYSSADRQGAWFQEADERYELPGDSAADTYLNQAAILDLAQRVGAEALHPGYGFLSENADFAAACEAIGVTFIGPDAAAMRIMGSKARARETAIAAGVPIIPGVDGAGLSDSELGQAADQLGYPLLIKASAGGGGKGMRVVTRSDDFQVALEAARREAHSAFGDPHMLLERYFTDVRHVEVQILGDGQGRVRHLFERDCSIQRRHQKIIEESPAPGLPPEIRTALTEAAVALAQAVNYRSAGTVEFIVTPNHQFYLLEMNTRLQVEHPVTEMTTGLDLAAWQIRLARGEPLSLQQADIRPRGHALECRLYAEDPGQGFLPSTGRIHYYRPPTGPGIRVDDGIASGSTVTPYYDPMLAKIVTWGQDRPEALARMRRALSQTVILGPATNLAYLQAILAQPDFQAGRLSTHFLEEHLPVWEPRPALETTTALALAALEVVVGRGSDTVRTAADAPAEHESAHNVPWRTLGAWRNVG